METSLKLIVSKTTAFTPQTILKDNACKDGSQMIKYKFIMEASTSIDCEKIAELQNLP